MHARLHPERTAISDLTFGGSWTYREFDRLVGCVATLLAASSVIEGDRVACLAKNRVEQVALQLACARLGAIYVPLNWRLAKDELEVLLADCTPRVIYGDDMAESLPHTVQAIDNLFAQCQGVEPSLARSPSPDIPSLMLYTSGTTGKPKGVLLTERNLNENAINFGLLGEVDGGSHFLCESPMFHTIGMVASIRPPLMQGARISVSDRFLPERTLARLSDPQLGLTHYFCVPQMAVALRNVEGFNPDKLRGLKAIFTGGAPHPAAQIRDWLNDGICIVDGYGMSESGTCFHMPINLQLIDKRPGYVGVGTPRVQHRLVADDGRILGPGEAGELQLKGENITCGYWQRPEEFQKALTEDGWFRTGDVLSMDEDGFYRVTDRKKDMYISGGENVYPAEVEALLVKYPGIKELAIVGVPDEKWGEVGCLFYVSDIGEIPIEQVEQFLTNHLARYKIPHKTVAIDAIPRNGVGKIMKHELRNMYATSVKS